MTAISTLPIVPVSPEEPAPSKVLTPEELSQVMADCQPHRDALVAELRPMFTHLMHEGLKAVEACLPDFRITGSADEKLHGRLRNQLLNLGNAKCRELMPVLRNYLLQQVFVRELVMRASVSDTHLLGQLPAPPQAVLVVPPHATRPA